VQQIERNVAVGARRAAHDTLYTDALGGARAFDRAQLTQGLVAEQLLASWQRRRVDSVATLGGALSDGVGWEVKKVIDCWLSGELTE